MSRAHRAVIITAALTGVFLLPSAARAQNPPGCAQPALTISAPATAVVGADTPVRVQEPLASSATSLGPFRFAFSVFGQPAPFFAAEGFPSYSSPPTYKLKMPAGVPAVVAGLVWQQYDATTPSDSTVTCAATAVIRPAAGAAPVVRAEQNYGATLSFVALGGNPCLKMAVTPVTVTVTGSTGTRKLTLPAPCGAWDRRVVRLPGLRMSTAAATPGDPDKAEDPTPARVKFRVEGRARRFRLTVQSQGRTLLSRWMRTDYDPGYDETIYEGTDSFVNVCINKAKNIYSLNGRLYCTNFIGDSSTVSFSKRKPKLPRRR